MIFKVRKNSLSKFYVPGCERVILDIADYDVGYNTLFGPQGYLTFQFSDLMGDHNIQLFMESQLSYNNDFGFSYQYLKERTDYQLAFIHQAQNFFAGYGFSSQGYPIDYMINSREPYRMPHFRTYSRTT